MTRETIDYTIRGNEIVEKDPDNLKVEVYAPWVENRSKTAVQLKYDNETKQNDAMGYIAPPEKPERAVTKGRF